MISRVLSAAAILLTLSACTPKEEELDGAPKGDPSKGDRGELAGGPPARQVILPGTINLTIPTGAEVVPNCEKIVAPATSSPAQATSPAIRYVHREGAVLRESESPSGKPLKKESKGAQVALIASDGEWVKVQDGDLTGWMRASILGTNPPD